MPANQDYELLDFGSGRKLERFGCYVLDRPSPAATDAVKQRPTIWTSADARFEREGEQGAWHFARELEPPWLARFARVTLELKFTDFGHVGLFAEQIANWNWISRQVSAADRPLRVLNLFAYTGGSTLAAAAAGAEVVHVDAAANVVVWARRNCAASELGGAPIRWITDDALKFVRRELKRKNHYDAIILDPPGYGHGPRGETWKLEEKLPELLGACLQLLSRDPAFLLLSCHSGQLGTGDGLLKFILPHAHHLREQGALGAADMELATDAGKRLHAGAALRWTIATRTQATTRRNRATDT